MLERREWRNNDGASGTAIENLQGVTPFELPHAYLALLSCNGGEGPLPVQPLWLALHAADAAIEIEQDGTFKEFFPGFFVIGSNGRRSDRIRSSPRRFLPGRYFRYDTHRPRRKRLAYRP